MKRLITEAIVALLIVSLVFSYPAATSALERQATGYTVTDSRAYPIIFIPGFGGSNLETIGGKNAWVGSILGGDASFDVLKLNPDGKTSNSQAVIEAGVLMDGGAGPYSVPVYQPFYDYMKAQGYELNDNAKTGKVFFDFPYDFRMDNRMWTKDLDKKVDEVLKKTKADKVILVGHSMGGLQARLYMKDAARAKKVAAVVFMGTPHHGAPMAFWTMIEGYNFGNSRVSESKFWEISANWVGGYQLLPDYPFIMDKASGKMLGIADINNQSWISEQEYKHYQAAQKAGQKYTIRYGLLNSKMADDSVDFHKKLGSSVDNYPGVNYYMIQGNNQDTVDYVEAEYVDVGLQQKELKLTKHIVKTGDGTVESKGAQITIGDASHVYLVKSDHMGIPANAEAQKILTDIRKQTNKEDFRNGLVDEMSKFAGPNIARLKPSMLTGSTQGLGEIIALWFLRGKPDEAKIKLRDELKDMASKALRYSHINVTINALKDETNRDKQEHLYLVIDNFGVKDAGTGVVSRATLNVTLDSYRTFEQVVNGQIDILAAYQSGKVTIQGTGLVNSFKAKLVQWISKYFKR